MAREPRSPYQRHHKAPYLYSEHLRAWEKAVRENKAGEAAEALAKWETMMDRIIRREPRRIAA